MFVGKHAPNALCEQQAVSLPKECFNFLYNSPDKGASWGIFRLLLALGPSWLPGAQTANTYRRRPLFVGCHRCSWPPSRNAAVACKGGKIVRAIAERRVHRSSVPHGPWLDGSADRLGGREAVQNVKCSRQMRYACCVLTMILLGSVLVVGSTMLSAAVFGPPPQRIGVGASDGRPDGAFGDSHIGVAHQGGIRISKGKDPVIHHGLKTDESEVSAKWEDLRSRMRTEEETIATCRGDISFCSEAARRFLEIVELGRQREGRARLGEINRAVNLRIKPADDWFQNGVDDFWSTPLATLDAGAGDCEDYAILKYAALRELGVALDDMRIILVRDTRRSTNHAVLAVHDDNQWLILDNRTFVMAKIDDVRHYFFLAILDQRGTRFEGVAFRD